VTKHNLAGDGQADLSVHGGVDKAVYTYSLDHYAYWQRALHRDSLPYGQFGENLTIAGLDETLSCIGDHLQIGTAEFAITQPRVPCFKLGIRFGNPDVPKLFSKAALPGFYLKIIREGVIDTENEVILLRRGLGAVSAKELYVAFFSPRSNESNQVLTRALAVPELAAEWRNAIEARVTP
jgi:MOSC domain-containing protein YiiM